MYYIWAILKTSEIYHQYIFFLDRLNSSSWKLKITFPWFCDETNTRDLNKLTYSPLGKWASFAVEASLGKPSRCQEKKRDVRVVKKGDTGAPSFLEARSAAWIPARAEPTNHRSHTLNIKDLQLSCYRLYYSPLFSPRPARGNFQLSISSVHRLNKKFVVTYTLLLSLKALLTKRLNDSR